MLSNKTICAYPWRSAAIRPNGATIPCCRYPNLSDPDTFVDNVEPRNSDHWVKLRSDMLEGLPIDGCHSCYQDENSGLISMRQYSLSKFIPIKNEILPLEQLEVALSNLCNLACVHCSSYFSTKWYSEDVRARRIKKTGVVQNDFNFDHWDLSKLTELKIIGGEPFMEQKRFIDLLKNLNLSNINLQICTNGTILPNEELKKLIESCKNVYLCVSLDGLYTTNDWYRWPSKFSEVVDNMKLYESWWKDYKNVVPIVHHVVNAINIFELEDFVKFMSKDFPAWKIEWDWIRWPHWQELSSLPITVKTDLISKFTKLDLQYTDSNIRPNPYKVSISRLQENPNSSWSTLKDEAVKLSLERNLNFLKMVTSYKKIWNLNYDQ
jgi:sulfatase maturation enzyme AslB (radical SAM superfamily)